jgi:hypothetical protein
MESLLDSTGYYISDGDPLPDVRSRRDPGVDARFIGGPTRLAE